MNILIQKYIELAIKHEEFTLNGDFKNGIKFIKNL